jgi:type IV pilus assembly protein PilW
LQRQQWHHAFILDYIRAMKIPFRFSVVARVLASSSSGSPGGRRKQSGLSIVELMVAMTIGLFLLLVIANLFIGSKQTYRNQDSLSRLQENGRFVITLLGKSIREAGYHNVSFTTRTTMYAWNGQSNVTWPFPTVSILAGTEGTSNAPDSITVSEDSTVDCTNATVTSPVQNKYSVDTTKAQLICTSVSSGAQTALLDGVEDLQVLYGETVGTAQRYVPANTTGLNMNNVYTVRVCVLLRTIETGLTTTPQKYTDCQGNTNQSKSDGRVRQAFSETFSIRSISS